MPEMEIGATDHLEPFNPIIADSIIAGATQAGDPIFAEPLPMIVWLRGDEPHAGDFSMTADEVMEKLGIKRSRLTQVSGRDLRVGRMRVDRYVRPVYRPADIDEYLSWTRATATHQKSSDMLVKAAAELQEKTDQLRTEALSIVTNSIDRLGEDFQTVSLDIKQGLTSYLQVIDERVARVERAGEEQSAQIEGLIGAVGALGELPQKVSQISQGQLETKSTQDTILNAVQAATQASVQARSDQSAVVVDLNANMSDLKNRIDREGTVMTEIAKLLTVLLTHHKELNAKLEQQAQAIQAIHKFLETDLTKGVTQDERYRIFLAMRRGQGLTNPASRKS